MNCELDRLFSWDTKTLIIAESHVVVTTGKSHLSFTPQPGYREGHSQQTAEISTSPRTPRFALSQPWLLLPS